MKTHASICKFLLLTFLAFALMSCLPGKKVEQEEGTAPTTTEADERGFDPLELPEDREIVPVKHPKSGEIVGQGAFVEAGGTVTDTTYSELPEENAEVDSLNNQAFRVQLFTTKVYGDARQARQVAEEIFDRQVFLDYEVPYYKLRVGSFADRESAEEYVLRAKSAGYTNAWVVVVNVRVKEAMPLYDDLIIQEDVDSLYPEFEEEEGDEP